MILAGIALMSTARGPVVNESIDSTIIWILFVSLIVRIHGVVSRKYQLNVTVDKAKGSCFFRHELQGQSASANIQVATASLSLLSDFREANP